MFLAFLFGSKLTLGLLKKQYLVHVGRESLSPEAKAVMKQVVEEELANMQVNCNAYIMDDGFQELASFYFGIFPVLTNLQSLKLCFNL